MEKIWLKSYAKEVPHEMDFESITLAEALARTAQRFPDRPALFFQGTTITYRRLDDMVSRFATALQALGIKAGDRIALLLPNLVQTVVATYGAYRVGAVIVMNNPLYTDRELEYQLNDSESTFLICLDVLIPRMTEMKRRTGIKTIVSCHIRDYLPFFLKLLFPYVKKDMHRQTQKAPDILEFTDLIKNHEPLKSPYKSNWHDDATLLYTGGTTGISKGVCLTHANLSCNVQQVGTWFPGFSQGGEVAVGCLPFFHVFGMTTAMNLPIYYGWADILIPKPEPRVILEVVQKYKATFLPAVPTMYNSLINYPTLQQYDLTSLKGCFSGGAPLPLETIKKFEKLTGAVICEGYGLTESSPVTHINPYGAKTKVGTIGVPIMNTNAKLVDVEDPSKEITALGEPGEICLKGPQIMKGYVNRRSETDAVLQDGWLLTGDVAKMDEDGFFTIVDRKKDMIITGGFNIYPRDVDEVLFTHPKVMEACVIGVPDNHSGERVKAFVVLREGQTATPEEIIEFCRQNLVRYKVPKYVEFVGSLPKSAVGKILRKELKRMCVESDAKN